MLSSLPVTSPVAVDLSRAYTVTEKRYQRVNTVFYAITSAYTTLKDQIVFPRSIHVIATWMGYYGMFDLVFAGPRLVAYLTDVIEEEDFHCRVNAILNTACEVLGDVSNASFVLDTLQDIGFVAKRAFALTRIATYTTFPLYSVYFVQSVQQLKQMAVFNRQIRYRQDLKSALQCAAEEGACLESTLYLSKKSKISLTAQGILTRMQANPALGEREGEKFMYRLGSRIFTRLILDGAYAGINFATLVLMVVPFHPLATLASTISGLVSIALSVIDNKIVLELI